MMLVNCIVEQEKIAGELRLADFTKLAMLRTQRRGVARRLFCLTRTHAPTQETARRALRRESSEPPQ